MLLRLAVGVIVAYGGIVGVMYLAQRSLMYVPDLARGDRHDPFLASLAAQEHLWSRPIELKIAGVDPERFGRARPPEDLAKALQALMSERGLGARFKSGNSAIIPARSEVCSIRKESRSRS